MSRVHRRGVVAGSGKGKTYADFQARLAVIATSGVLAWSSNVNSGGLTVRAYRVTAAAQAGAMAGSPWGPSASGGYVRVPGSVACRVVQHALPTEAAFLDQIANGWEMFLAVSAATTQTVPAVTRNGFTSTSASSGTCCQITEIIRWDGTQAWTSNPSTGSAETLYTW